MKKSKKIKTQISLVALAVVIILLAVFGGKLSTNNPQAFNNLKSIGKGLVDSVSNEIDPSIAGSINNFIGVDDSSTENNTPNISENSYKVVRVVDGDTIIIDYNGTEERVRLIGVDTPESVHPNAEKNTEFGKTASNFTKENLEGKYVKVELDVQERDKYGRLLAYIYVDDVMYNKTLLAEGYAKIATYPPNVKYVEDFEKIQEDARNNKKGLWGLD